MITFRLAQVDEYYDLIKRVANSSTVDAFFVAVVDEQIKGYLGLQISEKVILHEIACPEEYKEALIRSVLHYISLQGIDRVYATRRNVFEQALFRRLMFTCYNNQLICLPSIEFLFQQPCQAGCAHCVNQKNI